MDVRRGRLGLREEADEEACQLAASALGDERRLSEAHEEKLREHVAHAAAAPPLVEYRHDARVVLGLGVADFEPAHTGSVQRARHSGAGAGLRSDQSSTARIILPSSISKRDAA